VLDFALLRIDQELFLTEMARDCGDLAVAQKKKTISAAHLGMRACSARQFPIVFPSRFHSPEFILIHLQTKQQNDTSNTNLLNVRVRLLFAFLLRHDYVDGTLEIDSHIPRRRDCRYRGVKTQGHQVQGVQQGHRRQNHGVAEQKNEDDGTLHGCRRTRAGSSRQPLIIRIFI
jgi:hypothetical protein